MAFMLEPPDDAGLGSPRVSGNAETCQECGAIIEIWSREKHREFHKTLDLIARAQEKLSRSTRGFVRIG